MGQTQTLDYPSMSSKSLQLLYQFGMKKGDIQKMWNIYQTLDRNNNGQLPATPVTPFLEYLSRSINDGEKRKTGVEKKSQTRGYS